MPTLTNRAALSAFLRWKLSPAWRVGRWARGRLVCKGPGGASVIIEDTNGVQGRWRGWSLVVEDGPLCESKGDYYRPGLRCRWPEWLADDILAAVARIGTREVCGGCSGHGIEASAPDYACHVCKGAGTVPKADA